MRIVSLVFALIASFALATSAGAAGASGKPADASAQPADASAQPAEASAQPAEASGAADASAPAEAGKAADTAKASPAAAPPAAPAPPAHHSIALGPVGTDEQGRSGRIHTVASGDTLWDISEAYLGTPWVWPSIWQDNPSVPNPHRIHPGDRIWISPTTMKRVTDAEAEALLARQPAEAEVPAAPAGDAPARPLGSFSFSKIDATGLVDPQYLEGMGTVLESPSTIGTLISQGQRVYISLGEGQVQPGERFTVVRPSDDVRDPETHHRIGVYVHRVGWIEVTAVHPESSEAVIRESYQEVGRGDRLIPRVEPAKEFEIRPSPPPVEGQVAYTPERRKENGGYDVVFLNRGTDQGLGVGSPLEVVRIYDDKKDPVSGQRKALPEDHIANLLVVSAESSTAAAVVTDAKKEIERGDHFRGAPVP